MAPTGPNDPGSAYPQGQDLTPVILDADGTISVDQLPIAALRDLITGAGSGLVSSYRHVQPTAAATWSVAHQLAGTPTVVVQDASGVLATEVVYVDSNTLLVKFSVPTAGTAQLSV